MNCEPKDFNIQSHLEEIKKSIREFGDDFVGETLQQEIARLVVLLQRIEKLIAKTDPHKFSLGQRLVGVVIPDKRASIYEELNILVDFLQVAIESLFQKVPNLELARQVRVDIERVVCRYEHPVTGFFINRFMDLYRSDSIPLKVVTGLTISTTIATSFIVACLLALYLRPPTEIDRQIATQQILISQLSSDISEKANQNAASSGRTLSQPTDIKPEDTQSSLALAIKLGLNVEDPQLLKLKSQVDVLSVLQQQRTLEQTNSDLIGLILLVLSAGTLGSVVSILTRIDQFDKDQFGLTKSSDSLMPIFIGAFKPIIGSSFGLLFFALINSGIVTLPSIADDTSRNKEFFFCAIAFVVGFSERLAKDVIRRTEDTIGGISTSPATANQPLIVMDSSEGKETMKIYRLIRETKPSSKFQKLEIKNQESGETSGI